ncbi:MAG: YebC/PmpR family DNA-binding transcriptional regulator [bacterium]
MSGHSKWSTIRRKKEKEDAKRGQIFTKLIREITTAARMGGGDEATNPRLRSAIDAAKSANMPQSNIERAVKKGTGELPGVIYEEKIYEGYGPGGIAIMIDTLTDNTNRTTSEVRHLLTKYNGNLGETGCVSWMFDKKGLIVVNKDDIEEDKLMELILDAGAEDMSMEEDVYEIITSPEDFLQVKEGITAKGISPASSEVTMIPKNTVKVEGNNIKSILSLMEDLEEIDDVQKVYSNFDIDESEIEE